MSAYLLTWNPDKWSWPEAAAEAQSFRRSGFLKRRWSCGHRKNIRPGDRVFFLKQGRRGRGLFASGFVQGEPYNAEHFADPTKLGLYVNVIYDALLDPSTDILDLKRLNTGPTRLIRWATQCGGIEIPPASVPHLEEVWADHLRSNAAVVCADDFPDADDVAFVEGATERTTVMAVERSREARAMCIAVKGTLCAVCGFDFGEVYGEIGQGFIHVHHMLMLGSSVGSRPTDPRRDLEPVCPNCHCMLHRRVPPFSPRELREIMLQQVPKPSESLEKAFVSLAGDNAAGNRS